MAEEGEEVPYRIIPENGEESQSSRDYTGRAIAYYPNLDSYEGAFVEGIRQGYGTYKYANEDVYEGQWEKNNKHGIGKMTYKAGGEYRGRFENGKKHGEGVFTYVNKDIYSGWWRYGKKEGQGTYIFNDTQMKFVGNWTNGEMNEGKWIYPNGNYYNGKFEQNKPSGEGTWHFKNGNTVDGKYNLQKITTEDEEEVEEEGDAKPKVESVWKSNSNLFANANTINSHLA